MYIRITQHLVTKIDDNVLPPFIIFKGFHGAKLMNQYQKMRNGAIVFTHNYWMTSKNVLHYHSFFSFNQNHFLFHQRIESYAAWIHCQTSFTKGIIDLYPLTKPS